MSTSSDIEALLARINAQQQTVANEFIEQRDAYEAQRAAQMQSLEAEMQSLRSQANALTTTRNLVAQQRDLANATYTALAKKVEERRISEASIQQQVVVASPAAAAASPTLPLAFTLLTALAGGVLLIALGMLSKRFVRMDRPGLGPVPVQA
jgi:uncharacterized protein involved in exopolysaccharide biosynthesis